MRVTACLSAASSAALARPSDTAATPMRPLSRQARAAAWPEPRSPSSSPRALTRRNSEVSLARRPHVGTLRTGRICDFATRKALISLRPFSCAQVQPQSPTVPR